MENKFTLSFKSGTPIAKINGGKYDKKILYIKENKFNEDCDIPLDCDFLDDNPLFKNLKKRDRDKKKRIIKEYLEGLDKDIDEDDLDLLNRAKKISKNMSKKEFKIPYSEPKTFMEIIPFLGDEDRTVLNISGPCGVGKSYICATFAKNYKTMFPNNKCILFTRKKSTKTYDKFKVKIKKMKLDDNFLETQLEPENFTNTLCIFDDCDTMQGKIGKKVIALKEAILETGRDMGIHTLVCSHVINANNKTKLILIEMKGLVIFPARGNKYGYKRTLKEYVGLERDEIKKIFKLPSRWVSVFVQAQPVRYVLHEKGAYLLE